MAGAFWYNKWGVKGCKNYAINQSKAVYIFGVCKVCTGNIFTCTDTIKLSNILHIYYFVYKLPLSNI